MVHSQVEQRCRSPTRLEGMETRATRPRRSSRRSLRPALRGWKHDFFSNRKQNLFGSPTRLEGMETKEDSDFVGSQIGLRPALRGWKPRKFSHDDNLLKPSPTRLEGMETLPAAGDQVVIASSPTRLEGMETKIPPFCPILPPLVSDPP